MRTARDGAGCRLLQCFLCFLWTPAPYTQTFVSQIKAGVREEYIITVDGAYIAKYDLFITKKNYE